MIYFAKFIKNEDIDLCEHLPAPDFSTGGQLIYNRKELEQIYKTGRGSVKLRAKYQYDKKDNCIEVTEIPYTTNIEAIVDKIIALVKAGKIKDITDVRDESDLNGLKIAIDLKRGTNVELLMHKLFAMTPLADNFSCNFNVLIHGRPMVLGVGDILKHWTEFRMDSIRRQIAFDIQKKSENLNTVVEAVKEVGTTIKGFNNSVQKVSTKVEKELIENEEKIAPVVQWGNAFFELRDLWKKRQQRSKHTETAQTDSEILNEDVEPQSRARKLFIRSKG